MTVQEAEDSGSILQVKVRIVVMAGTWHFVKCV
jgi:hypothetical protein